ncbi:tautomerase family protein [Kitasatospora viridis]|nr:tautomerase family protein [Kitasatospora viridis]
MPLVRIDTLGADAARLDALGNAVHQALVETLGIPQNDRFQILTAHDGRTGLLRHDDHLGVQHDDGIVFVAITLRSGRGPDLKRALYRRIAELAEKYADTEPRNVVVTLTENGDADWSVGNGEAQLLDLPLPG